MNEYQIANKVESWIKSSQHQGQNIEVQLRNTDTREVVHTTMSPLFVIDVCKFTAPSLFPPLPTQRGDFAVSHIH